MTAKSKTQIEAKEPVLAAAFAQGRHIRRAQLKAERLCNFTAVLPEAFRLLTGAYKLKAA